VRFSNLFQQPAPAAALAPEPVEEARVQLRQPEPLPAAALPEELDARVRLVGEWQLGEG
jgi:hypothetical protein